MFFLLFFQSRIELASVTLWGRHDCPPDTSVNVLEDGKYACRQGEHYDEHTVFKVEKTSVMCIDFIRVVR